MIKDSKMYRLIFLPFCSSQLFPRPTLRPIWPTTKSTTKTTTDCTPRECDTAWNENICDCITCSKDKIWDSEEWTYQLMSYQLNLYLNLLPD